MTIWLKRRDAAITRIIDMAGHVVLYQFNEDSKGWDRKKVEGALLIFSLFRRGSRTSL